MDSGTLVLFAAVALLGANHVVVRLSTLDRGGLHVVFWALQLLNLVAACALAWFGMPGLKGMASVLGWVLALLFVWHIVQNNNHLMDLRRQRRDPDNAVARAAAIRAALRAGEDQNTDSDDDEGVEVDPEPSLEGVRRD